MQRRMFWLVCASALLAAAGLGVRVSGQTELDRVIVRVAGRPITRSEIRMARALKLVSDTSSDEVCQRELENRLLALAEVGRLLAAVSVAEDQLASRRAAWEQGIGGSEAAQKLLAQYEMSDADLSGWLRDDLRIAAYLDRQFSTMAPGDRSQATADWYARLRQRADLR